MNKNKAIDILLVYFLEINIACKFSEYAYAVELDILRLQLLQKTKKKQKERKRFINN